MAVRCLVLSAYPGHVAGPMVLVLLQEGAVSGGETLLVEGTGTLVRVQARDVHTRQTEAGLEVGLRLHPAGAAAVAPGSTLVSPPGADRPDVPTTG